MLFAGLVGIPVFGVLRLASGFLETPVEIGARAAFALAAGACLAASARPGGDRWAVLGSRVLTFALQGWFQFVGPWDARAQTALLVTSLATLSFTTRREMVALWGWTTIMIVAGHLAETSLQPQLATSVVANTLVAGVVGAGVMYLRRLELALVAERDRFESKVEERTSELRAVVDQLRTEVTVRRTAEEAAVRASLARSVFLANMSHELRTPLNAILGYTELLLEEQAPEDTSARDLARIRDSAHHLLRMIEDVLDLAKIDSGRLDLRWQVVQAPEVAARATSLVQPLATSRGLALVLETPQVLPLRADPDRLTQVLVNLLSNAVKFTRQGEVALRVTAPGREVVFEVSDTGPGIPAEQLEIIFDRFVQVDGSTTRRIGGTGLGLAICKELCTLLGATLAVRSTVGVGSTFTVTFRR